MVVVDLVEVIDLESVEVVSGDNITNPLYSCGVQFQGTQRAAGSSSGGGC